MDINAELLRKVEKVLSLLEGEGEAAPGLLIRVATIERVLFGRDAIGGIAQQVASLTKLKSWLMGTLSALAGAGLAIGVQYAIKHI